jgi:hypothetical protein
MRPYDESPLPFLQQCEPCTLLDVRRVRFAVLFLFGAPLYEWTTLLLFAAIVASCNVYTAR